GAALVRAVERWAAARGLPRLRLRSNVVRAAAHRFYLRQGFGIVKTQHAFEKSLIVGARRPRPGRKRGARVRRRPAGTRRKEEP
ncbi:MAG TPA: GNAT family N-acetyltransferase, partial [Vicinamibacterales bacterium]|nr:GNAT family N-acetyltransferase [Vicinamibacterales bacterium]